MPKSHNHKRKDNIKKRIKEIPQKEEWTAMGNAEDAIDFMTSREFQNDIRAHIENISDYLRGNPILKHYYTGIMYNKHLFRDKIVLNVGCGIGILALFAAKAGAKHVYAVDRSNVIDYGERIVRENGYASKITFYKGCIKSITLPVEKVDAIVCDWPGYTVIFQSLCEVVIYARDKWLKKDGVLMPDKATIYIGAFEDVRKRRDRIDWWQDVYGFNMNCIRDSVVTEPSFHKISTNQILTNVQAIKTFDMNTASCNDLKVHSRFMLRVSNGGHIDGVFTYSDIEFTKSHTQFKFSTSPWAPLTNFMQTALYFENTIIVNEKDLVFGGIEMRKARSNGDWNYIDVEMQFFKGEPQQMNLEFDMIWHFKQYGGNLNNFESDEGHKPDTAIKQNSESGTPYGTSDNSNNNVETTCYDVPADSFNKNGFKKKIIH